MTTSNSSSNLDWADSYCSCHSPPVLNKHHVSIGQYSPPSPRWPYSISHYTRRFWRSLAVLVRVIFCVLMTLFALSASLADLMSYRGSITFDQQSLNNAAMIFPWSRELRTRRLE